MIKFEPSETQHIHPPLRFFSRLFKSPGVRGYFVNFRPESDI